MTRRNAIGLSVKCPLCNMPPEVRCRREMRRTSIIPGFSMMMSEHPHLERVELEREQNADERKRNQPNQTK